MDVFDVSVELMSDDVYAITDTSLMDNKLKIILGFSALHTFPGSICN